MIRRWAKIKTEFEGFHRYPAAPDDVAFLRALHRHIFHVTLHLEQFHDERDVEYVRCKRWLSCAIDQVIWDDASSCEHIAMVVGTMAQHEYPNRQIMVEVTEDGENGAVVEM